MIACCSRGIIKDPFLYQPGEPLTLVELAVRARTGIVPKARISMQRITGRTENTVAGGETVAPLKPEAAVLLLG